MTLYIKINKHIKIYTVIIVFRVRNNRFQGYSKEKIYLFPLTFLKTNWVGKASKFFLSKFLPRLYSTGIKLKLCLSKDCNKTLIVVTKN